MVARWSVCGCVCSSWAGRAAVRPSPPRGATRGARTVVYHPRDLVALRAKVRYSTLIVLPEGEEVVEATCGDKDVWLVNVRGGLVSVKPAKAGSETNLNRGDDERTGLRVHTHGDLTGQSPDVDLTVYLEPDGLEESERPRHVQVRAGRQVEDFRAQADLAREQARRATEAARAELEED